MLNKLMLAGKITHLRNEFGFAKQIESYTGGDPQLVYSSLKGQLFWVYPVEGYDDKGTVLNKDGLSKIMPLTVISNMEIKLLSKIMMILMILIILLFDYLF